MEPVYFPEGAGLALEPGQQIVLQMGYYPNNQQLLQDYNLVRKDPYIQNIHLVQN